MGQGFRSSLQGLLCEACTWYLVSSVPEAIHVRFTRFMLESSQPGLVEPIFQLQSRQLSSWSKATQQGMQSEITHPSFEKE